MFKFDLQLNRNLFSLIHWFLSLLFSLLYSFLLYIDFVIISIYNLLALLLINILHIHKILAFIGLPILNQYPRQDDSFDISLFSCCSQKSISEAFHSCIRMFFSSFKRNIQIIILQLRKQAFVSLKKYNKVYSSKPTFQSALTQQFYDICEGAHLKTTNPIEFLLVTSYQCGNLIRKFVTYYKIPLLYQFSQLVTKWNQFLLEYFNFKLPPHDDRLFTFIGTTTSHNDLSYDSQNKGLTCWDIFHETVMKCSDVRCLGQRKRFSDGSLGDYQWLSYKDVETMSLEVGTAIWRNGICPLKHFDDELYYKAKEIRFMGIFAKHSSEWVILQLACNACGITVVPMYETLGDEAVTFIANQTEMNCIVVSIELWDKFEVLLKSMATIKTVIIVREGVCFEETFTNSKLGSKSERKSKRWIEFERRIGTLRSLYQELHLFTFEDLVKLGRIETMEPRKISPDEVATLYYTSGTTGVPKGVIASHRCILISLSSLLLSRFSDPLFQLGPDDIFASYLPMAHILGGLVTTLLLSKGVTITIIINGVSTLNQDLQKIQPSFIIAVPRLLNRLYDEIMQWRNTQSWWIKGFFDFALEAKIRNLRRTGSPYHFLWDAIFFHHSRGRFGKCYRMIFTGSAPLNPMIEEQLKVLLCIPIIQVYGLTETMGAIFANELYETHVGHVGCALPFFAFTLEAIPEMGYDPLADPPRGEILIRGPALSAGFFRRQDLTREVFTEDGWFHSGDVGELMENGSLKIIDRKKDIFKLAQGEYVAPAKIEAVYQQINLIHQAFVYGHSTEDCLVAIIVPEGEASMEWAKNEGIQVKDIDDLVKVGRLKNAIFEQMKAAEINVGLKGFEKVKAIRLSAEAFTLDNDCLTPTLKLKRSSVKRRFSNAIDEMYFEISRKK